MKQIQNNTRTLTFNSVSAMRAFAGGTGLEDNEPVFLSDVALNGFFYWDNNSTAADDGASVIKITTMAAGRFIRLNPYSVTSSGVRVSEEVATAGQTVFDVPEYTTGINNIQVFLNGSSLLSSDFTETSSTQITLDEPASAGDTVRALVNLIPNLSGTLEAASVSFTQSGTGAVSSNVQTKLQEWVSVKDSGATGDGSTDDFSAMSTFISGLSSGQTIVFPKGTYKSSGTLSFAEGVSVIMDGTLSYTGTGVAMQFGSASTFNQTPAVYRLRIESATDSDFSSLDNIGAKFINVANSRIDILKSSGFTVAAAGVGDTSTSSSDRGFAWNEVNLYQILHCLIGFDLRRSSGGGGLAFVNENRIYGGHFVQRNSVATDSTTDSGYVDGTDIQCYCFRVDNGNGNLFSKPAIEFNYTRSADSQQFKGSGFEMLNNCTKNRAESIRFEASDVVARLSGTCTDNIFKVLYSDASNAPTIEDTSERRSNLLKVGDDFVIDAQKGVWDSGNVYESVTNYNSSSYSIPNMSFAVQSVHANPILNSGNAGWIPLSKYWRALGGLYTCVRIDTSRQKRFVVKRQVESGYGGRIAISARQADGTIWTDGDADSPYVFSDRTIAYNSQTFGAWVESADSDADLFFEVRSDVDHVILGISGGTAELRLKKLQIISVEGGAPVVSSGVAGRTGFQRISQVSPTAGYYARGEMVQNHNPAAAQAIGWKAEADGWSAQTAWGSTTAYSINDIVYNGSNAYQCVTAGTSAGSGGPTGTGTGITDGTVEWDYIAPRVTFRAGPVMP